MGAANQLLLILNYNSSMQKKSLLSLNPAGFHKIAYTEWGCVTAPRTLICVGGLTRNSRDFDMLAQELIAQQHIRVICPDLPGRGASDWFANARSYTHQQYLIDLVALIARLNVPAVTWLGTSMGGVLGMYLAAQNNSPINALILNDVGAVIPRAAIKRIAKYTKKVPNFLDLNAAQNYLRSTYANGGPLTAAMWQHITEHSVVQQADGSFTLAYDPKIVRSMPNFLWFDIKLWDLWNSIKCPALVLRAQQSDVLLKSTADQMLHTGTKTTVVEIANCGHAPMLMTPDQIAIINNWLKNN